MEYNFIEIGQRIRRMRKEQGWSQDAFIDQLKAVFLPISRNRIVKIEKGDEYAFSLDFLMASCKVFGCDIGYLMGEYGECKTRDNQFIHEETGLSEAAVLRLVKARTPNNFIDFIISSDSYFAIDQMFDEIVDKIDHFNSCMNGVNWIEETAENIETGSAEPNADYDKLKHYYHNWVDAVSRWEAEQNATVYQMGLLFGNMLNQYLEKERVKYRGHD